MLATALSCKLNVDHQYQQPFSLLTSTVAVAWHLLQKLSKSTKNTTERLKTVDEHQKAVVK